MPAGLDELLLDLGGRAERFVAMVGVDDGAGKRASVNFEVWGDDRLLASTPVLRAGDAPRLLVADLRGVRVLQLITGATGLDDWEWGVTLLADDPAVIKEIVYEMRFDEVSARYGEFGPFFVGLVMPPDAALARAGLLDAPG